MYVFIDFRSDVGGVEAVLTVPPWARDPVVVSRFNLEVIGFEAAAFETLERLAGVVQGRAGLGKGDATNARRADDTADLRLDVHDSVLHERPNG